MAKARMASSASILLPDGLAGDAKFDRFCERASVPILVLPVSGKRALAIRRAGCPSRTDPSFNAGSCDRDHHEQTVDHEIRGAIQRRGFGDAPDQHKK